MSRDLAQLRDWSSARAAESWRPTDELALWAQISREVGDYLEGGDDAPVQQDGPDLFEGS